MARLDAEGRLEGLDLIPHHQRGSLHRLSAQIRKVVIMVLVHAVDVGCLYFPACLQQEVIDLLGLIRKLRILLSFQRCYGSLRP